LGGEASTLEGVSEGVLSLGEGDLAEDWLLPMVEMESKGNDYKAVMNKL